MSNKIRNTYTSNIIREYQKSEDNNKNKSKSKKRATVTSKINTKDIFENKSEIKIKTTISKFNFEKSNEKRVYYIKSIKTIENPTKLYKKLNIKISKNNFIKKPLNIYKPRIKTESKDDKQEKKTFQSKTLEIKNDFDNNLNIINIYNNNTNIINSINTYNTNSNFINEISKRTIKNIDTINSVINLSSNDKYKSNTFMPNRVNSSIDNTTINTNTTDNLQKKK